MMGRHGTRARRMRHELLSDYITFMTLRVMSRRDDTRCIGDFFAK